MKDVRDKERLSGAAKAVREVINAMPSGEKFHGRELRNRCVKLYPELKNTYIETFLREMREYCKDKYVLVSRSESLYEKVGDPVIHIKRPELQKFAGLKQQTFDFGD